MNRLRILVVGAGIGGLAAGIALRRCGFDVEVYERASELRPLGAGICMWPNGAKAANSLGLGAELEQRSPMLTEVRYHDRAGTLTSAIGCEQLVEVAGARPYPLARADLHVALLGRLGDTPVHLGKECVGASQDNESATVEFSDGTSATGDVVVAADGVWSTLRAHVTQRARLCYLYTTWLALVGDDLSLAQPGTFSFYADVSQRVGVLPVSDQRLYVFLDAPVAEDWGGGMAAGDQLRELFGDWGGPVGRLVQGVDPDSVARLPVCDLDPLDSFVRGRIVLIGDAAHATAPTLGQGGALAMEDAIVLSRQLAATSVSVADALNRYDGASRARAQPIVKAARARAQAMVHGVAPAVTDEPAIVQGAAAPEAFMDVLMTISNTGPLG